MAFKFDELVKIPFDKLEMIAIQLSILDIIVNDEHKILTNHQNFVKSSN